MEEEGEEATPPAAVLGEVEAELVVVLPPDPFPLLDVTRKITSIALSSRLGRSLPVVHRAIRRWRTSDRCTVRPPSLPALLLYLAMACSDSAIFY